jgi:hypothetical protein
MEPRMTLSRALRILAESHLRTMEGTHLVAVEGMGSWLSRGISDHDYLEAWQIVAEESGMVEPRPLAWPASAETPQR